MTVCPPRVRVFATQLLRCRNRLPRGMVAGSISAVTGAALVHFFPRFEFYVLAQSAAWLTALFCGSPIIARQEGFALPAAHVPVIVTSDCSAADFFCMVAALVTWQLARRTSTGCTIVPLGLAVALPVTIFVNALRISTVAQAHRWFIPLFPDAYSSFLHLATGVAVFLPSLITLHLLLEFHGNRYTAASR
jgi:exosortase/archaeosortase family protein